MLFRKTKLVFLCTVNNSDKFLVLSDKEFSLRDVCQREIHSHENSPATLGVSCRE